MGVALVYCLQLCKYRQSRHQAEEPKGQNQLTSTVEASESDGGQSTKASSQEVTAEPTVQKSTSAISVTAVSKEVALKSKRLQALSKQAHHKIRLVRGPVRNLLAVNETRSASDLAAANNMSSAGLDNFDLRLPT